MAAIAQTIELYLLGRPEVTVEGVRQSIGRRHLGILAVLLVESPRHVSRERLARLFWPSSGRRAGLHSLSQSIYRLRTVGFRDSLLGESPSIRLERVASDLHDFRAAIKQEHWLRAAELYRGPFLDQIDIATPDFDSWVQPHREALATAAKDVLLQLLQDGLWEPAKQLGTELLRAKHSDLEIVQGVLGAYRATGDDRPPAKVLADLKVHPTIGSTPEVGSVVEFAEAPEGNRPRRAIPFIGRRKEFGAAQLRLQRAFGGRPTSLLIVGEAGIGKTAIGERLRKWVAIKGAQSFWATGYELERNVPLGVVEQWIAQVGSEQKSKLLWAQRLSLGGAFPSLFPSEANENWGHLDIDHWSRQRLFSALAALISQLAQERPLVLFLDEAHRADNASLAFVHYLIRSNDRGRFAVVLLRGTDTGPEVRYLWPDSDPISLGPLSAEDVGHLVEVCHQQRQQQDFDRDTAAELYARTGGHPFLLAALLNEPEISPLGRGDVPKSVRDFLQPRMDSLSTEARYVLAALGVTARPIGIAALAEITRLSLPEVNVALSLLDSLRLLDICDETIAPAHGLASELAFSSLPTATQRALVGRAARVMSTNGESTPAILAPQFDIAGFRESAYAAAWAAAHAALDVYAYREVEYFCKIGIANSTSVEEEVRVRVLLAEALVYAARPQEAIGVVEAGLDREDLDHTMMALLAAQRIRLKILASNDGSAIEEALTALEIFSESLPPDIVLRVLRSITVGAHHLGDHKTTVEAARQIEQLVHVVEDPRLKTIYSIQNATVLGLHDSFTNGFAKLKDLEEPARHWPDVLTLWLSSHGSLRVAAGQLLSAEESFLRALDIIEGAGIDYSRFPVMNNLAVCLHEQGRYGEAYEIIGTILNEQPDELLPNQREIAEDNQILALYEMGKHEEVLKRMHPRRWDYSLDSLSTRSKLVRWGIRGLSALELGRMLEARECSREIGLALRELEYWTNDFSYTEIFLARMMVIEGKTEEAVKRLGEAMEVYSKRDLLCAFRIGAERLRLLVRSDPHSVLRLCDQYRHALLGSGAVVLVDRFASLAARARARV